MSEVTCKDVGSSDPLLVSDTQFQIDVPIQKM